ncbi:MAG: hypothetical protein ACLR6H_07870 [Roseburia sp.]
MEEYKKYVDHQHAPESLIADTIKKVKAEEARKAQTQEAAKVTGMPQAAEVQKEEKAVWKDHDGGNDGSSGSGGDRSAGAGLSRGR